jgi:hypothetical protein
MQYCIQLSSNSMVPQVPGFCLPRFAKWASDMILASPDVEKTSFFKCKFAESDMACPYEHLVIDDHSYVLSVADRARIERTTEADPEKSFSIHCRQPFGSHAWTRALWPANRRYFQRGRLSIAVGVAYSLQERALLVQLHAPATLQY